MSSALSGRDPGRQPAVQPAVRTDRAGRGDDVPDRADAGLGADPGEAPPFGYGIQALVDAATKGASIFDLWGELLPLAGFTVVLPVLGMLAFRALERHTRQRGSLELT